MRHALLCVLMTTAAPAQLTHLERALVGAARLEASVVSVGDALEIRPDDTPAIVSQEEPDLLSPPASATAALTAIATRIVEPASTISWRKTSWESFSAILSNGSSGTGSPPTTACMTAE